jgi:hypothetical protein
VQGKAAVAATVDLATNKAQPPRITEVEELPISHGSMHAKMSTMTRPTTGIENLAALYQRAFKDYGSRALWNMRPVDNPTPADALAITKALRAHGGMDGRRLAEHIERMCRAAH